VISPTHRPLPDYTQHSTETNIHAPAGFKHTILESERPRTHALDHWDRPWRLHNLKIESKSSSEMLVLIYPTTRVMILVFALVYLVTPKAHLLFQFPILYCQSCPNALRACTY